jgi:hypothetical protein
MYTVWMWIQTAWALNNPYHLEGCILFTKYVVLFYIIYRIVSDETMFALFSWGHIVGCFIFGWTAYNMSVSGRLDNVGGAGLEDANVLGMHQLTGLAFAGFFFIGMRDKMRWVAFATVPFILNSVLLTVSRGAFIGTLSGGLATLFFSPRAQRLTICGMLVLGTVLFFRLANDQFWQRMDTLKTTDESQMEASQRSRVELFRYGWKMAQDYPWGAGHRGHLLLSPRYMPDFLLTDVNSGASRGRSAHNTFMAALVEQGYPGAIMYIALQIWILVSLLRLRSLNTAGLSPRLAMYRAALSTALIICLVCGQFINILIAEVQIWLIALLVVLKNLFYMSIPNPHSRNAGHLSPTQSRAQGISYVYRSYLR